jgi:hypothetical protein
MKHIDTNYNSVVLKSSLKERGNIWVRNQLSCGADRLTEATLADFNSSGEEPPGEHTDLVSLLHDRLCRTVRLCGKFRLVNLKVKSLQALAASDKLGF